MARTFDSIRELLGDQWVLVVEPALGYRSSIKSFLSNLKIRNVRFVKTVEEAHRELLTIKAGLFIVEWSLADVNGIQFCRELKQSGHRSSDIPFLLITVENLRSDVILASEVGIDGYLLKPFSFEDFAEAVLSVLKAKNNPTIVNLLVTTAHERLAENLLDEAHSLFERALDEAPGSARALSGLAKVARLKGDHKKAVELYLQALSHNADFVEGMRELLEIYEEHGPLTELVGIARRLHDISPDNPKYTLILARSCLELGNLGDSEAYFKRTIRLSPKLADAYKGLGKLNMMQEDYQSAMKNFRKALDLDRDDVSTLNSLGMAFVRLGKFKEGIEKYLAALRFSPHDARILFNLGYAKEKTGETSEAIFYYQQALNQQPDFEKARRRLDALKSNKLPTAS